MKRTRALELYRALDDQLPSAAMDACVLGAAREAAARRPARRTGMIATATAAMVGIALVARWMAPPARMPDIDTSEFGITEGQADAWLATFDINPIHGPGSQEGLP